MFSFLLILSFLFFFLIKMKPLYATLGSYNQFSREMKGTLIMCPELSQNMDVSPCIENFKQVSLDIHPNKNKNQYLIEHSLYRPNVDLYR